MKINLSQSKLEIELAEKVIHLLAYDERPKEIIKAFQDYDRYLDLTISLGNDYIDSLYQATSKQYYKWKGDLDYEVLE